MEFLCGWLVHAFFQMFHNSAVIEIKAFFFLHKTGLQSKITFARNDVSLPPCNALSAWQTKTTLIVSQVCRGVMECCFSCRALIYLTAMKKATSRKAISEWPLICRHGGTQAFPAENNVNEISACGSATPMAIVGLDPTLPAHIPLTEVKVRKSLKGSRFHSLLTEVNTSSFISWI